MIEKRSLIIYGYCLMNNHLHMIANTKSPFLLSDVMRDFKKFTSRNIAMELEKNSDERFQKYLSIFKIAGMNHCKPINIKVWKDGNHAIELYSNKFFQQKLNYIHLNPVRAGYTDKIEDWPYSSAVDYFGGKSVLNKVHLLR